MSTRHYEIELEPGRVLRGSVDLPPRSRWPGTVVVFCHGFKGFKDWGPWPWFARRLAERGFVVNRFNFSHAGVGPALYRHDEPEKFAVNTYGLEIEDLGHLLDRRGDWGVPAEALGSGLGLVGHSRGGLVSLLFNSERVAADAVVTLGSPGSSSRFDDAAVAAWREHGALEIVNHRTGEVLHLDISVLDDYVAQGERYDLERALRRRAVPTLVIHGDADESVPVAEAALIHAGLEAVPRDLWIIEGGGHTFGAGHPFEAGVSHPAGEVVLTGIVDRITHWFGEHVPS